MKLPIEIQKYLKNDKAESLDFDLCQKYGLNGNQIKKYNNLILTLFSKELPINKLRDNVQSLFGLNQQNSSALACDILGIRLLVLDNWLKGVPELIANLGGDSKNYAEIVTKQKDFVEEEEILELDDQSINYSRTTKKPVAIVESNPVQEIQAAKKIFGEKLVDILKFNDSEFRDIMEDYNFVLISLLTKQANLKNDLTSALLSNSEPLTSDPFILDQKPQSPTIANWLKDFIKQFGSNNFDDLVLARFITNSPNTKNLNDNERQLVSRLLKTYRNLKFFPASMPENPEDWEIIPLTKNSEESKTASTSETEFDGGGGQRNRTVSSERIKQLSVVGTGHSTLPSNEVEHRQNNYIIKNNQKQNTPLSNKTQESATGPISSGQIPLPTTDNYSQYSTDNQSVKNINNNEPEDIFSDDFKNKVKFNSQDYDREEKIKELEELKKALQRYKVGSLEYQAVEEGIERLNNQILK